MNKKNRCEHDGSQKYHALNDVCHVDVTVMYVFLEKYSMTVSLRKPMGNRSSLHVCKYGELVGYETNTVEIY